MLSLDGDDCFCYMKGFCLFLSVFLITKLILAYDLKNIEHVLGRTYKGHVIRRTYKELVIGRICKTCDRKNV